MTRWRPRLTDDGLAAFDNVAQQNVESGGAPGVVALVAHGDQVHVTTAGGLSLDGPPVARDSVFRIASMTKPVAAATALALVAEGLFSLDQPVDGLLPELADRRVLRSIDAPLDEVVPASRPITLRDLLTFTFGFGVAMEMFAARRELPIVAAERAARLHTLGPPDPDQQPPTDEWMAALGALPLMAQPGERWLYNTGASVPRRAVRPRGGRPPRRGHGESPARSPRHDEHGDVDERDRVGSRRRTPRGRAPSRSGIVPTVVGATHRRSPTARRGSCPRSMTSTPSPTSSCAVVSRCSTRGSCTR